MIFKRFVPTSFSGLLLSAVLVVIPGAKNALAQNDDIIHACINQSGHLRIVESQADCNSRETHINWNIIGSEVPPGAQTLPPPDLDTGWASCQISSCSYQYCSDSLLSGNFLVDVKIKVYLDGKETIMSGLADEAGLFYDLDRVAWWTVQEDAVDGTCLHVFLEPTCISEYKISVWFYNEP